MLKGPHLLLKYKQHPQVLPETIRKGKWQAEQKEAADLVYIWSDQVIQLVENSVDDFDEQVTLLIFKCWWHQQRQDLIKQWPCSEFPSFISNLSQGSLNKTKQSVNSTKKITQSCRTTKLKCNSQLPQASYTCFYNCKTTWNNFILVCLKINMRRKQPDASFWC